MKNSILKFPLILFGIALFSLQVSCQNNSKKSANSNKKEVAVNTVFPKAKSNTEWQNELTPAQYQVMVKKGTERAFENPYFNNHKKGVYVSAATGEPMFRIILKSCV